MRFWKLAVLVSGILSGVALATSGQVEYTAQIFSYDNARNGALQSHSFARFTKLIDGRPVEVSDISWLPAPGHFRGIFRQRLPLLRAVPGMNYSLEATLAFAAREGLSVASHGVFSITPEFFEAAKRRQAELQSGVIAYKMLDGRTFPGAANCIHALTGIIGYLNTGLQRGFSASNSIVGFFLSTGHMLAAGSRFATPEPVPAVSQPDAAPQLAVAPQPAAEPPPLTPTAFVNPGPAPIPHARVWSAPPPTHSNGRILSVGLFRRRR